MARLTAVRKIQPGRQGGLQQRLSRADTHGVTVWLDADNVLFGWHGIAPVGRSKIDSSRGSRQGLTVFTNPSSEQIGQLLRSARVIAVVGLSADPSRPSHHVASELQHFGYRIIPVTPTAPEVLGERSVPDLAHLSDVLRPGERVDIVDVFRRPEHVEIGRAHV